MNDLTPAQLQALPLPHAGAGDKETRGCILVVGGSLAVPGGVRLAGEAALRAGAGKLQIATCRSIAAHLGLLVPEALVHGLDETATGALAESNAERLAQTAPQADALLLGPGMMEQPVSARLVCRLLDRVHGIGLVLDAGALHGLDTLADALRRHAGQAVITPHAGEMAHLLDESRADIEANPLGAARRAAARLHCVVAMKGAATHVVSPDGGAWCFTGGTVGLATSGSGDVLAGLIAGFMARGADPVRAALWGVHAHGSAGLRLQERYGGIGFLARELPAEVPHVLAALHGM